MSNHGGSLRITERPSARDVAGSGRGYYYAAVTSDKHATPVAAPTRIQSSEVATQPQAALESAAGKSDYYYAHRRKIDFVVPTPPPQRLPDASMPGR